MARRGLRGGPRPRLAHAQDARVGLHRVGRRGEGALRHVHRPLPIAEPSRRAQPRRPDSRTFCSAGYLQELFGRHLPNGGKRLERRSNTWSASSLSFGAPQHLEAEEESPFCFPRRHAMQLPRTPFLGTSVNKLESWVNKGKEKAGSVWSPGSLASGSRILRLSP